MHISIHTQVSFHEKDHNNDHNHRHNLAGKQGLTKWKTQYFVNNTMKICK